MQVSKKEFRPYLNVIVMLVAAIFLLAFTVDVNVSGEAGIVMALPDRLGEWLGDEMRFCHSRDCRAEYYMSDLEGHTTCPKCGGPLAMMSYIESVILPGDTEMLKKRFELPQGRSVFVSIVLSGAARDSIHRPQLCLTGQGYDIIRSHVIQVPIAGRHDLGVMVLDTVRKARTMQGQTVEVPEYYAYWFVGKDRETPYHTTRMIWMGLDRVLYNVAHRWAYIAVGGFRTPDYIEEINDFVQLLYPALLGDKAG